MSGGLWVGTLHTCNPPEAEAPHAVWRCRVCSQYWTTDMPYRSRVITPDGECTDEWKPGWTMRPLRAGEIVEPIWRPRDDIDQ